MSVDKLKDLLSASTLYLNNLIYFSNNTNGLNDPEKRRLFIKLIKDVKSNFVLLQEIHNKNYLNRGEFTNYKKYYSVNDQNKWGVAILINNNTNFQIKEVIKDKLGCVIAVNGEIDKHKFLTISIYLPHNTDTAMKTIDFIKKIVEQNPNKILIIGGDFNFEKEQNTTGYKNKIRNYYNEKLDALLEDTNRPGTNISPIKFTHYHKQTNTKTSIDRVLSNVNTKNLVTFNYVSSSTVSDHNPIIIGIKLDTAEVGKPPWRLKTITMENKTIKDYIKTQLRIMKPDKITWATHFDNLLKNFKTYLKKAQKDLNKLRDKKLEELNNKLSEFERIENLGEEYEIIREEIKQLEIEKLNNKCYEEARKWYEHGEKPTKAFFNRNKENKRTVINSMKNNDKVVSTTEEILDTTRSFYKNLYDAKPIRTDKLNEILDKINDNYHFNPDEKCEQPFTPDEIEAAINNIAIDKAPGPDGLTMALFKPLKKEWAPILCNLFNEISLRGKVPKNFENSIISLVPKPTTPKEESEPKDWRPITLTNVAYKILTKCVTERVTNLVAKHIGPHQTGFIQGRDIRENIITAQALIEHYKNSNKKLALLLIDWEKAFDRIDHRALLIILQKLGFPTKLLHIVKAIYRNSWAQIRINNKLSKHLKINSGVKQGCPLSPLLFIIVIEILHTLIRINNDIIPNPIIKQKSQGYADDTMLLINKAIEFIAFKKCITDYCDITGAKANVNKSKMLTIGKWDDIEDEFQQCSAEQGMKYLGVKISYPIDQNMWRQQIYKIELTLRRWKFAPLSMLGKKIIVESLATSKLWYLGSIHFIHHTYLHKIERIISKFYKGRRKKNVIQIKKLTAPINKGGLDFVDIRAKSTALTSKWTAKYLTTKAKNEKLSPWMLTLENYLNESKGLLHPLLKTDTRSVTDRIFDNITNAWRRIHYRYIHVKQNTWLGAIKNNKIAKSGRLLYQNEEGQLVFECYEGEFMNSPKTTQYTIQESNVVPVTPKIANGRLLSVTPISKDDQLKWITHIKSYKNPVNIIEKFKELNQLEKEDKFIANQIINKNLLTSAKSLYKAPLIPRQLTTRLSLQNIEKLIKNIKIININNYTREFLLLIMYNCLPTRHHLKKTKQIPEDICEHCFRSPETIEHALFECKTWIDNSLLEHTKNYYITYRNRWQLLLDIIQLKEERLLNIIITIMTLHFKWNMKTRSKMDDFNFCKYFVILKDQITYLEKQPHRCIKISPMQKNS